MNDQHDQDLERRMKENMAALWQKYLPLNRERVAVLERAIEAVRKNELTDSLRTQAESEAHKLAGASGTMGHMALSRIARRLEEHFRGDAGAELGREMFESLGKRLRSEFEATVR